MKKQSATKRPTPKLFTKNATATATRSVGRPPVVLTADTWESVTNSLLTSAKQNVRCDLVQLSRIAKVSVPTIRNLLHDHFGNAIVFKRGRKGGVTISSGKSVGRGRDQSAGVALRASCGIGKDSPAGAPADAEAPPAGVV